MVTHVLDSHVLVLNRVYLAVRLTTVRRAVSLLYQGRARAILPDYSTHDFETWRRIARATNGESVGLVVGPRLRAPRVIVLTSFDGVPRFEVRFTRANVYARDGHACQYCGVSPGVAHLTLDHVRPLSRGGDSGWENVVTCCRPCNRLKADRLPEAAGLRLARRPRRPRWHPLCHARRREPPPDEWRHFVDESLLTWGLEPQPA